MSAFDRMIELEHDLPTAYRVQTRSMASIRLDDSPLPEYIEAELSLVDQLTSARLFTRYGDSWGLTPGSKLWEWTQQIIEENI